MVRKIQWFGAATIAASLVVAPSGFTQEWDLAPVEEAPAGESPAPAAPTLMMEEERAAPSAADEMQEIQMQLQQISAQLGAIQQQAFELQEVMDAFSAYEDKLRTKMLELSPDAESDIAEAEALMEELRAVDNPAALSPEEAEGFQEMYMEFQQAMQRLQPLEQQASMDPEIQAAQGELETLVQDAMSEISPEAPTMINQRDQLIERYMQLEQQQQQQMQQQQPTPDEPPMLDFPEM